MVFGKSFPIQWHIPATFSNAMILICRKWSAAEGPKKDNINIGNNPQYRLEVKGLGAVWVNLTRHITDKVGNPHNIKGEGNTEYEV